MEHSVISVIRKAAAVTRRKPHLPTGEQGPGTVWVLSGGGAAGAGQSGMITALLEAGQVPDCIVGCSAGALNAAWMAADPSVRRAKDLEAIWHDLAKNSPLTGNPAGMLWRLARGKSHLLDPEKLTSLVTGLVGQSRFEELQVPLKVVTSALPEGTQTWHESGPLAPILLASCALPGLLPPRQLADGRWHVDGAVTNAFPIDYALSMNPHRVWALDVAAPAPSTLSLRAQDVLMAGFSMSMRNQAGRVSLASADPRVQVLSLGQGARSLRDFSQGPRLVREGYQSACRQLEAVLA